MEKRLIGQKKSPPMWLMLLLITGGLGAIAGGILFFYFVLRGAGGGAISGLFIGVGAMLIWQAVSMLITSKELVFIDMHTVYVRNRPIPLNSIINVIAKGSTLIIHQSIGRPVSQGMIANVEEVAGIIKDAAASATGVNAGTRNDFGQNNTGGFYNEPMQPDNNDFYNEQPPDQNNDN